MITRLEFECQSNGNMYKALDQCLDGQHRRAWFLFLIQIPSLQFLNPGIGFNAAIPRLLTLGLHLYRQSLDSALGLHP